MNLHPPSRLDCNKQEASAIVLVLLVVAVVGVLMAGWIAIVNARGGMVEQMTEASKRRIALENSKALAQEFMLERVLPSVSGSAFDYDLSDPSWGGISAPAWGTAPMLSVQKAAGYNHFNPGSGDGYTMDVSIVVKDGDANPTRKYQIKSRSPLLSGTLLYSQTPTLSPSASVAMDALDVNGPAFLWAPTLSMHITPTSYSTPEGAATVTFSNSSGSTLLMSNFAVPRMVANPRVGGASCYTGQFDALSNANAAANSSAVKAVTGGAVVVSGSVVSSSNGVTCDGAGNVVVTLNTAALSNVYIPGEISSLTLQGQPSANDAAADDLPSTLILVDQPASSSRDLTSVILLQNNSRRLVLAVKKATSSALPIQFTTSSATWRMLLELENTQAQLTASGTVTLKGGIRTDLGISLTGGNVRLTFESDPKYLERLATRAAWVESFEP